MSANTSVSCMKKKEPQAPAREPVDAGRAAGDELVGFPCLTKGSLEAHARATEFKRSRLHGAALVVGHPAVPARADGGRGGLVTI
jgi:hypothetical protein